MISQEESNRIVHILPFLWRADPLLVSEFMAAVTSMHIPAGKDGFIKVERQQQEIALMG
jgi:hypothetical protein